MEDHDSRNDLNQREYKHGLDPYSSCIACNNFNPHSYSPSSFTEISALPAEQVMDLHEKKFRPTHLFNLPLINNISCVTSRSLGVPWLPGLACLTCQNCVAVYRPGHTEQRDNFQSLYGNNLFRSVEDVLRSSDKSKDGWMLASDEEDMYVHLVLNFVVYRLNEPPASSNYECNYGAPKLGLDKILLLWESGQAVGFATIREEASSMVILDTIFVRMSHRGKGYTKHLVNQLLESPDVLLSPNVTKASSVSNNLLGFSSPISNGMFRLLIRMIATDERRNRNNPNNTISLKERLWLVNDTNDSHQNIWWSAPKMARERQLDIRKLVGVNSK